MNIFQITRRKNLIRNIKIRIRGKLVSKLRKTKLYPYCYRSYWHSIFFLKARDKSFNNYLTARPNPGAGIGHQMANWIAGNWFAQNLGLNYAYYPFPNEKWDVFLGFGENEKSISDLKKEKYKVRILPLFDEVNISEVERTRNIIHSYNSSRIVFLCEQDQFYRDQYGVMNYIQNKFYSSSARKNDFLVYNPGNFNIAIHVRRGDIIQRPGENNPNLTMRYQSNEYFVRALTTVLAYFENKENLHVYLFSQGKKSDFPEFMAFKNLHFCLDMGAQDSFLHMVYADALITSKSSFSYKPALLNRGIKFCPANFWHGYPDKKDWILLDDDGQIVKRI